LRPARALQRCIHRIAHEDAGLIRSQEFDTVFMGVARFTFARATSTGCSASGRWKAAMTGSNSHEQSFVLAAHWTAIPGA